MDTNSSLTFSARTGLKPLPPQLQLNQLSRELMVLLHYAIHSEMERSRGIGPGGYYLKGTFLQILRDYHVRVQHKPISTFQGDISDATKVLAAELFSNDLGRVFDFVEWVVRHPLTSNTLRAEVTDAFVQARAAYRVKDGSTIVAVGTADEAEAIARAIDVTDGVALGAHAHLVSAGEALRHGRWADTVRESIHAVESVATQLAPGKSKLSDCLGVLERNGRLHGSLKAAFSQLYGYASDQEGVRHALVFGDEADVDEADALFMLGACASFVTYMLGRAITPPSHVL